jgi:regulator of protease activity HflC (stomatin/prohibitin superfamily)
MQAQAEREKNARVTFGESEVLVAKRFEEASKVYADNPVAYALRQSNMLYESIKVQGNTIVVVPSETLNSMGFGNLATTIAYLENTKKADAKQGRQSPPKSQSSALIENRLLP